MAHATASTTLHVLRDVEDYLQSSADHSARVAQVADAVTAFLETETRRVFVSRSLTEVRDGTGTSLLQLWRYPIVSISTLTILRDVEDAAAETIASTDYRILSAQGKVQLKSAVTPFTAGLGNVTVTYTAGFGAQGSTALPQDIVNASLELIKLHYDQRWSGSIAANQVTLGPATFTVRQDIPWHVRRVIEDWKERLI